MHNLHNMHLSANTTQVIYSANFYTRNENEIIKRMCNSCSVCFLYSPKYTRKYSGLHRTFEKNSNVGEILYADIAYLHRDSNGNKYALILTDRLTSYTVAYALTETTMKSTSKCIEEYLRHLKASGEGNLKHCSLRLQSNLTSNTEQIFQREAKYKDQWRRL